MSAEWYKEQPSNRNFLNPIGFLLKLEKFEGVDFFCQSVNIPDVTMPTTEVASPFRNLPIIPGGGVTFGDFSVRFIVDEDLKNYLSKISDEALYSYNVYQIEGEGRKLFLKIDGDEDTIMGLPIKKIKEYLNNYE